MLSSSFCNLKELSSAIARLRGYQTLAQLYSVFVATPSQPELSDSCTISCNILALEVWLGLSAAELSDDAVDSKEIKLKLVDKGNMKAQEIALLGLLVSTVSSILLESIESGVGEAPSCDSC